jgi:hypothetical protein
VSFTANSATVGSKPHPGRRGRVWGLQGPARPTARHNQHRASLVASAEYSKDDSVENYYDIRSGFFSAFDGNGADRSVGTNGKDGFKRTVDGVSLKLDGAWQGMDLVSITAHRGVDWKGTNDQDYTELAIITQSRKEKQTQWSQEFPPPPAVAPSTRRALFLWPATGWRGQHHAG